ncbi:MAG: hypothetical protein ACEQSB_00690 [Undibacterium sp.]
MKIRALLKCEKILGVDCVTGPGRSGAIASVYASHILGVPFLAFGVDIPPNFVKPMIIDTARESGKTLRKAARKYAKHNPIVMVCYEEPPRVTFWYEAMKPQRYIHERIAA